MSAAQNIVLSLVWGHECHRLGSLVTPNRLIKHTKKLMDKEEKLCIKILQTLREMLDKKDCIQESVSTWSALPPERPAFREIRVEFQLQIICHADSLH